MLEYLILSQLAVMSQSDRPIIGLSDCDITLHYSLLSVRVQTKPHTSMCHAMAACHGFTTLWPLWWQNLYLSRSEYRPC